MSRVAILSVYCENYRSLNQLTWNQNKALYCARYGYTGYNYEIPYHGKMGFDKFRLARNILDHHDWVWIVGCDTLITNFQKDVWDAIDLGAGNFSFAAAYDANGLNCDSVLIRNDVHGRTLLEANWAHYDIYDNEQHTTVVLLEQNQFWRDRAKITYQWEMNAYLYGLYPGCPALDAKYKERGEWQEGDLLMHWPGLTLARRMLLAEEYIPRILH